MLSISRVQLILCKDYANERKESLLSISRVQLILCKDKLKSRAFKTTRKNLGNKREKVSDERIIFVVKREIIQ